MKKTIILFAVLVAVSTAFYHYNFRLKYDELQGDIICYYSWWHWQAGNPWQFRVLVPLIQRAAFPLWGVQYCIVGRYGTDPIPWNSEVVLSMCVLENIGLFLLFVFWLRRLRIGWNGVFAGLMMFGFFVFFAEQKSYLMDCSYIEPSLFLLAGLTLDRKWAGPIVLAIATLNRETAGMLVVFYALWDYKSLLWSVPVYCGIYGGLHLIFPAQDWTTNGVMADLKYRPGLTNVITNLTQVTSWVTVLGILLPLIWWGGSSWKGKNRLMVCAWRTSFLYVLLSPLFANFVEARMFLLPLSLGLIPAVLKLKISEARA